MHIRDNVRLLRLSYLVGAVTFASLASLLWSSPSRAAHVQKISQQSATSMCSGHGGGTKCSYCDPQHCHDVSCSGKQCTNFVYDGPILEGSKPGGGKEPPPPKGVVVSEPPSKTNGTKPIINPPTSAGANKGPSGGGTVTIEKAGGQH
jgi:hypothetical protein